MFQNFAINILQIHIRKEGILFNRKYNSNGFRIINIENNEISQHNQLEESII